MKFKTMDCVHIQCDTMAFGIPVGDIGYVIDIDRDADRALRYLVRVPSKKESWWMAECDLVANEEWLTISSEKIMNEAVINYAIKTKNRQLFESHSGKRMK